MFSNQPSIGHNNPPEGDIESQQLQENLTAKAEPLLQRFNELEAAFQRIPETCDDDETAAKFANFGKQIQGCEKDFDAMRVSEKEPYLKFGRVVDGFFKKRTDTLEKMKRKLQDIVTVYQRKKADAERKAREEAARLQREEAARKQQEALDAAAAAMPQVAEQSFSEAAQHEKQAQHLEKKAEAPVAELARVRSDLGAVASLKTTWVGEITDRAILDLEAIKAFIPLDALQKAVNGAVKAGLRDLRGATIYEKQETNFR